ncbi:MAG: hypothetical protein WBF77_06835 [Sulfurimonadaceae bacterium]
MYRIMKQSFYVLTVTTILLFSGCSSDSGDTVSGDSTPSLPPTNAVLGSATAQNGLKAALALFNVQDFVVASGPEAKSGALQAAVSPVQAPISPETVACPIAGTVTVSGDISETSYDMTMRFSDCQMEPGGPIFLSGTLREIARFPNGFDITYIKDIYMTDVLVHIDSVNTKIYAGSQVEIRDITYNSATIELSMQSETSGEIERLENLVMKIAQDGDELLCYAAGDVYVDNNLSHYLQINTEYDPLCNGAFTLDGLGTLISGSMELIGSDGNVSMNVTSDNNITIEGTDGTVTFTVK